MVDQELDALLVGALYGELAPADEARLAAHLESHPTDRAALDDLRATRQALVDSRFFELWFDPPAALSAQLVQEAARRAPRKAPVRDGEGWFARVARALAARPAVAAAAMFVVVAGAAGTLYVSKSGDLAEPSAVSRNASTIGSPTTPAAAAPEAERVAEATNAPAVADPSERKQERVQTKEADGNAAPVHKGIVVAHHEPQPKDLDKRDEAEAAAAPSKAAAEERYRVGLLDDRTRAPAAAPSAAQRPPVQAQASAEQAPSVAQTPPPAPVAAFAGADARGGATPPPPPASSEDAWARDQHARVASLVRNGHCEDAAPLAATLASRAPSYYNAYVATDRALRPCMAYIAGAVEKQDIASRAAKAKAAPAGDRGREPAAPAKAAAAPASADTSK